jgi:hypothetical protein
MEQLKESRSALVNRRFRSKRTSHWYRMALGLIIFLMPYPVQAEVPEPSVTSPIAAASVRFEVVPIDPGAELLTLFFTDNPDGDVESGQEVPLITVLRDTLGSADPAVHRLRYVWVHTNASPGLRQRIAAATPFVYSRVGNTRTPKNGKPSPAMDLSEPEDRVWKSLWEILLKGAIVDPRLSLLESVMQTYGENRSLYVEAQLARASTALDMEDSSSVCSSPVGC